MPDQDRLEEKIDRMATELEHAKDSVSDAEGTVDDLTDELAQVREDLKKLGGSEPMLDPRDLHFRIKVDELANAIYEGRVVSLSMNGSGSRDDALRMAATMLSACGLPV